MHICMNVCMYYTCVHVYMYECMYYTRVYVYMYERMYVCMHLEVRRPLPGVS